MYILQLKKVKQHKKLSITADINDYWKFTEINHIYFFIY